MSMNMAWEREEISLSLVAPVAREAAPFSISAYTWEDHGGVSGAGGSYACASITLLCVCECVFLEKHETGQAAAHAEHPEAGREAQRPLLAHATPAHDCGRPATSCSPAYQLTSLGLRTTHSDSPSTCTPRRRSSRTTRFWFSGLSRSEMTYAAQRSMQGAALAEAPAGGLVAPCIIGEVHSSSGSSRKHAPERPQPIPPPCTSPHPKSASREHHRTDWSALISYMTVPHCPPPFTKPPTHLHLTAHAHPTPHPPQPASPPPTSL